MSISSNSEIKTKLTYAEAWHRIRMGDTVFYQNEICKIAHDDMLIVYWYNSLEVFDNPEFYHVRYHPTEKMFHCYN